MASENAQRDDNRVTTLMGVTDDANLETKKLLVDPTTGRLKVTAVVTGGDADAIHDNVAGEIAAITEKGSPVAADLVIIEDSEDTNNKKSVQVGNLPSSGETNTASNQGTDGVGVYDTKVGVDLQFRNVAPASSKVTTTLNTKDIDIDIVENQIDHDSLLNFEANEHFTQANITTVGTIGTGVWQGTAIDHERGGLEADVSAYNGLVKISGGATSAATIGIADDNIVEIDGATVASGEYAKFTANGLESKSFAEVKTDLSLNNVENTALTTWVGANTIVTVGTISTGTWEGTTIAVDQGGTGETSYTDGQLLIGNTTGNTLTKATLTAGEGIDVTNGNGSITILGEDATGANKGIVELATSAEIDTGTDTGRAIPIDQFVASKRNIRWLVFNLVEAATDCAVATNIGGDFVSPIAGTILQSDSTPFYLYATNSTAGTTGTMVVDISLGGTSIMTTNKLDFDTGEKTTTTASTPPDLTDTTIAVGDILTIDIDSIHTTAAKGLTVYMAIRE